MMSIDPHHPLLIDNISVLLNSTIDLSNVLFKLTDYDGILYVISGYNSESICFTVLIPQLASVGEAGGYESIETNYAGYPINSDNNSEYTLLIDRSQLPDPSLAEERKQRANEIAQQFSMFRTHFLSGPFIKALRNVKAGTVFQPREVLLRSNEKLWIIPGENRVNFIFQVNFSDHTDGSLSKVFLQEFVEAKRQVPNSPVITFSQNVPDVMSMFKCSSESTIGYLCITILKEQIRNEEETGRWLSGFKQYLTYHIHACKTYLHMRMRKKTEGLLKVLKNAVPERLEEKTFRRVRATKTRREESKIVYNFN